MNKTSCKITSHELARELLDKPDGILVANHVDKEFFVDSYRREVIRSGNEKEYIWNLNLKEINERG